MSWRKRGAPVVLALLLGGCAQWPGVAQEEPSRWVPSAVPQSFRLEGRISVKNAEESFSGGVMWSHAGNMDTLLLKTPLGQGVAELSGSAEGFFLKDAQGRQFFAQDAEGVLRQSIGMALPVSGLAWWVLGHPRRGADYVAEANSSGHLAVLQQDGWRIEFARYAQEGAYVLPHKLLAHRGEALELRMVVDRWELP